MVKTTLPKMALKPYLEAIKEHCESLSKEELVETILSLAREVPVGGRAGFLDNLRSIIAPKSVSRKSRKGIEEITLDRIEGLREEIEERIASIEEGTYWDDRDDWEGYEYDEEPDYVTEEQREELEQLFLDTGSLFLDGQLKAACRLYEALFGLLEAREEMPARFPRVDIREERARYCRCVYETADPVRRMQSFLECMKVYAPISSFRLDLPSEPFPMLQDVIDARPGELENLESFIPVWEKMLASFGSHRAAILRLEAVELLEGVEGISRLAREWQSRQPHSYLFWIQRLQERKDWQAMLDACRQALDVLPKDSLREQAAGYMVEAAGELGDAKAVLIGKREGFLSLPNEENLLGLLKEAAKQNVRSQELDAVLARKREIKNHVEASEVLYLKMLLMAGRLGEAFKEGKDEKSYGWSYGKAGVLFAAILSVLAGDSPKAVVIRALLEEYADGSYSSFGDDKEERKGICREMLNGLASLELKDSERRKYLAWVDRIGRDRVEYIVSNQHRRAYGRAARVLCALAEYYALSKERDKAMSLQKEFLHIKFPRHRAFQSEVKRVVGGSVLLKDLRIV